MLAAWRRHRARNASLDGLRDLLPDDDAPFPDAERVRVVDEAGEVLYDGPAPIPLEYLGMDAPPRHLRLVD
jgi:hypothetical protein